MCQAATLLAFAGAVHATVIPQPVMPYGTDTVRLPDGFQCSSATSPSAYMDAGVYQAEEQKFGYEDKGVYVRVMIPIMNNNERINCNRLFEIALKEREQEKALASIKEKVFQ